MRVTPSARDASCHLFTASSSILRKTPPPTGRGRRNIEGASNVFADGDREAYRREGARDVCACPGTTPNRRHTS